jgi:superoxide dismutase, Cu-Zn family
MGQPLSQCKNAICVFDQKSSFNKAKISGTVTFHQCNLQFSTVVRFNLSGFKPNTVNAIHIHESGDLTKGCESLCAHYNPYKNMHGSKELYGSDRHVGDLINNIHSDSKGNFVFEYEDDLVDLFGEYSVIGRSIVIHEKEDDLGQYRYEKTERGKGSKTTGNAGSRISCSLIGISTDCL